MIDFRFLLGVEIVCTIEKKCGLHLLSVLCLLIIYVDHVRALIIPQHQDFLLNQFVLNVKKRRTAVGICMAASYKY